MHFRILACFIVLAVAATGFAMCHTERDLEIEDGYKSLFNGKDLTGWVAMGSPSWKAENGLIICTGQGSGWLRSIAEYQGFILRLEFKISPRGNSGIFIRATEEGNPAFTGMEIQIMDDHGKPPVKNSTGALYAAVAPAANVSKPAGEWNEIEIACIGRRVKVTMNGQRLYAVNLDSPQLNAELPEDQKLTNRVPTGFIGLQNHGNVVEFRNIRIKDMTLPEKPVLLPG